MPKIQLATQKANAAAAPKMGKSLVSNRGGIRTTGINPNAGQTRYTPVTGKMVSDNQIMESFINAAGKVADRQAQVLADEAVLEYSSFARDQYYGKDGEKGYSHMQASEALDEYGGYSSSLDSKQQEIVGRLSPGARQKALLRIQQSKGNYQSLGSQHNVKQLEVMEKQTISVASNEAKKDVDNGGNAPWVDGTIENYLSMFNTPQAREVAATDMGTYTMYEAYNRSLAQTGDPELAYGAALSAAEVVLPQVGQDGQQKLEYWLLNKKGQAATHKSKIVKQQVKENQDRLMSDAPLTMLNMYLSGNPEAVTQTLQTIRGAFSADPEEASSKVIQASKDAIDYHVASSKGSVTERAVEVDAMVRELSRNMDVGEVVEMGNYVQTASNRILQEQRLKDTVAMAGLGRAMEEVRSSDAVFTPSEPPGYMLPENKQRWRSLQKSAILESTRPSNYADLTARGVSLDIYKGKVDEGTLTQGDIDDYTDLVIAGRADQSGIYELGQALATMKKPGYKPKNFKKNDSYKRGVSIINQVATRGFVPGKPTPSASYENPEVNMEWIAENEAARGRAISDWTRKSETAALNGETLDPALWFADYYSTHYKAGQELEPGFWSTMFTGMTGAMTNAEGGYAPVEGVIGVLDDTVGGYVRGANSGVMDR